MFFCFYLFFSVNESLNIFDQGGSKQCLAIEIFSSLIYRYLCRLFVFNQFWLKKSNLLNFSLFFYCILSLKVHLFVRQIGLIISLWLLFISLLYYTFYNKILWNS